MDEDSHKRDKYTIAKKKRIIRHRELRKRMLVWMGIIIVTCMIVVTLMKVIPMVLRHFVITDEYLPMDIERQYQETKEQIYEKMRNR